MLPEQLLRPVTLPGDRDTGGVRAKTRIPLGVTEQQPGQVGQRAL